MKDRAIIKYMDSTPWAMEPTRLDVLHQVVADHIAGRNVELASEEEASVMMVEDVNSSTGNIAVIPIHGTVMKRAHGLSAISGARTTLTIQQDIQDALDNPNVSGIVLDIDSPGGTVDGTKQLADFVKAADKSKPVVAYANGMMCSAAMWIGSAARHIVGFPTTTNGSIGVIIQHQDWSKAEEDAGVNTTYVYAGKYKAMGNSSEPLSNEAKDYIQGKIDGIYSMFVDDIAANRGLDTDYVVKHLATAATFLSKEAVDLKLIDSVGTMEDAIAIARKESGGHKMGEKVEKVEMSTEVQAQFDEMKALLATSQEQVSTLVQAKEDADAALAKVQEEAKAKEKTEQITALFTGCKVSEDFMATMQSLEVNAASVIAGEMKQKETQVAEVLKGHVEPVGTDSGQQETIAVTSIDEAVSFIMNRDNIDVDAAGDKAVVEFAHLFNK